MGLNKIAVTVFALLIAASRVAAVDETALSNISGKIIDPNGSVVIGARIEAVRAGTSVRAGATTTNAEGEFSLQLARGEYTINVMAEGFAPRLLTMSFRMPDERMMPIMLSVTPAEA